MASDTLHETIEEEDHGEDKGSVHCLDIAFATIEVNCLAGCKGKITEGLHETADHDGQEEDVHVHGSDESHDDLVEHYHEVPSALIVEYLEWIQKKYDVYDPHIHS